MAVEIRLLSFNIHKGVGWRSRKSSFNQIQSELIDRQPDIVLLQEVLGFQFEALSSKIWTDCRYGKNVAYKQGHQGNAILSKFPITYAENIDLSMHRYEHRGLLHSISQSPEQNHPLHLLCVHLGLFPSDRHKQIDRIIEYIKSNIPENQPVILGGDFNDWNGYANKPLKDHLGLNEAFITTHNACARTYPAWSPIFKLDRIYVRGFQIKQAHRLYKKPWKHLSDHIGIEVTLEYHDCTSYGKGK
jgi:endonuclease/exonuclease/phosphatase family metal-dependent hydrolase